MSTQLTIELLNKVAYDANAYAPLNVKDLHARKDFLESRNPLKENFYKDLPGTVGAYSPLPSPHAERLDNALYHIASLNSPKNPAASDKRERRLSEYAGQNEYNMRRDKEELSKIFHTPKSTPEEKVTTQMINTPKSTPQILKEVALKPWSDLGRDAVSPDKVRRYATLSKFPMYTNQDTVLHPINAIHRGINEASHYVDSARNMGHAIQSGAAEVAHHLPGLANVLGHIL